MRSPPLSIVVVDDEPIIANMYADWLGEDHDVRTAYDGAAALEAVDDDVDMVFLDRRMPELTGDEVVERLRERGFDGQIAMVTAVEPDFDVLEMGFDTYLVKPVFRDDIERAVSALVARHRYDDRLQEYFGHVTKAALLESNKFEDELAENDDYQRIQDRIDELDAELHLDVEEFEMHDFEAVFYSLADSGEAD